MGYADEYGVASPLDSIAWEGMNEGVRIQKLAFLYRANERSLRYAHRNYDGPTLGTVKAYTRSLYTPPRGRMGTTVKAVLEAVKAQKEKVSKREGNRPWTFQKRTVRKRMTDVLRRHLRVLTKGYGSTLTKVKIECSAISLVGDTLMFVSPGGYYHMPRIYMRHKPTGGVKVAVLESERSVETLSDALLALSPNDVVKRIFAGASVTIDFDAEAFSIDGVTIPWAVRKVYRGEKEAKTTMGKPIKQKD